MERSSDSPPSLFAHINRSFELRVAFLFCLLASWAIVFALVQGSQLHRAEWLLGWLVGAAGVAVGLTFATKGALDVRAAARLVREGAPVDATVTAVRKSKLAALLRPKGVEYDERVIYYRYLDHNGLAHEGNSGYLTPKESSAWKKGDVARIHVDRDRQGRSIWIGRVA